MKQSFLNARGPSLHGLSYRLTPEGGPKHQRGSFLDLQAYLGSEFVHPGDRVASEAMLRHLHLRPGGLALDLGCGTGASARLIACQTGARVIALDLSRVMLRAARRSLGTGKVSRRVSLLRAAARSPLPFPDAVFDAVYAESVVALAGLEPTVDECVRVLRPGGSLALNERVWKPDVSQAMADEVNTASQALFGISAATGEPLDRDDWTQTLRRAGLVDVGVRFIDSLLPTGHTRLQLRRRIPRWRRYMARPSAIYQALRFRNGLREGEALWAHLESCLFVARKPER